MCVKEAIFSQQNFNIFGDFAFSILVLYVFWCRHTIQGGKKGYAS
jgi:hypothetical protein